MAGQKVRDQKGWCKESACMQVKSLRGHECLWNRRSRDSTISLTQPRPPNPSSRNQRGTSAGCVGQTHLWRERRGAQDTQQLRVWSQKFSTSGLDWWGVRSGWGGVVWGGDQAAKSTTSPSSSEPPPTLHHHLLE